jgi:hypothetical protein
MSVIITGMHRSGTSATARIVDAYGLTAGSGPAMAPAPDNPRGFFERRDVLDFNDAWLRRLGGAWWAPPPTSPHTWQSLDELELRAARERLDLFDAEGAPWYSKDPRTSLLLPLWDRVILQKHPVIICVRHPGEVASSLWLRNGFTARRALALWAAYTAAAVNHAIDRPALVIDYESFLEAPMETTTALEEFLQGTGHRPGREWSSESAARLLERPLHRAQAPRWNDELLSHRKQLIDLYRHLAKRHAQPACEMGPIALPEWVEEVLGELRGVLEQERKRAEAEEEALSLRAERDELIGERAEARRQADELSVQRSAAHAEIERLTASLAAAQAALERDGERTALLEAELKKHADRAAEACRQTDEVSTLLSAADAQIERLSASLSAAQAARERDAERTALLETELKEHADRASDLGKQLAEVREEQVFLRTAERQTRADYEARLAAAQVENSRRRTAMTEMSAELERRRARAHRAEARVGDLERQWHVCQAELLVVRFERDQLRRVLERTLDRHAQSERNLDLVFASHSWRYGRLLTVPARLLRGDGAPRPGTIRLTEEQRCELVQIGQSGIFDADWYRATYPDVVSTGEDPLEHFIAIGWREGRDPGPLFAVRTYLEANRDVAEANINPLTHYLAHGWREGRLPRADFDPRAYIDHHRLADGIPLVVHAAARTNGSAR